MSRLSFNVMCLAVIVWATATVAAPPSYAVIDLGVQRNGEGLQWSGQMSTSPPANYPELPGAQGLVAATNDTGAAGFSVMPHGYHATLWRFANDKVSVTDLGTLEQGNPDAASSANGLNERGTVVGRSTINGPTPVVVPHAFLWREGIMTDLGTIPGPAYQSQAEGINDSQEIVGWTNTISTTGQLLQRAFVYIGGTMYNLTFYELGGPNALLADATGIDCQGNISAVGIPATAVPFGSEHSYLLVRQGALRTTCPK